MHSVDPTLCGDVVND